MIKGKVLAKTLGFSNRYYLLSTVEDIMNNVFFFCFCRYNKSHWGPKEYLTPLTSMHLWFHKRKSGGVEWHEGE